jgi:hypothetical protein
MGDHLTGRWLKRDLIEHLRNSHPEVMSARDGSVDRVARLYPLDLLERWHQQQHQDSDEHPAQVRPGSA